MVRSTDHDGGLETNIIGVIILSWTLVNAYIAGFSASSRRLKRNVHSGACFVLLWNVLVKSDPVGFVWIFTILENDVFLDRLASG